MPTLLVNRKMDPALAARILASVTGRRNRATTRSTVRLVATVRFAVLLAIVGIVAAILFQTRHARDEFATQRSALFRTWSAQAASLTPKDSSFLVRLEKLLARYAGPYSADIISEQLRAPEGLAAVLARPSVYIRGPVAALGTSAGLAEAASDSGKDSLLVCLIAPPPGRTEKELLKTARTALAGGAPVQRLAPQVHRLLEAVVALPFVLPPWGKRVENAKNAYELKRLELALKKAPIAAAKRVLKAQLVIAVFDEPGRSGATTEFDGENTHYVRLAILELDSGKPLLVIRRLVDPIWITPNRRSLYARELDGCKLALEVRDAIRGTPSAAEERPASTDSR